MLAYLLWHRPADVIERDAYEHASKRFHLSLRHSPPAGFRGSTVLRLAECPWLASPHEATYEDWYLLDDFTALGVLNEAAVTHGHSGAHDSVARRFGSGAGGLYGLMEGHADPADVPRAVWISRLPGQPRGALAQLLGDGMDPAHASLWRRALVLGPAPEYCLLSPEPPKGVSPTRLPPGWRATVCERELLWPRTARLAASPSQ
ncbi:MAG TPA: hypothetical protein VNV37_11120 [Solirubrobacteraceae bacterium]|jgi:hypothetical protein|nr:hypothetical protein [Solirubrobacteraceae bacterium]